MLLSLAEKMIDGYFALMPRAKPDRLQVQNARIIAHRGAYNHQQGIMENTDAAFLLAKKAGCWGIEFDVHETADGVWVVNHDPTLQRLWGHDVTIAQLTYEQLFALEPRIPLLTEVVAKYKDMHLFIELKSPLKDEQSLARVLEELSPITDFHLLALDAAIFASLSLFPKEALLLVAVHHNVSHFCDLSISQHYGGVMGSYLLLTHKKREQLWAANQLAGVGFVNSKNSLYRELNKGIHWIFTNKAVEVCRHLQALHD